MNTLKQDGNAARQNGSESGANAANDKTPPAGSAPHASGREINDYYCEGNAPDEEDTDHYSVGGDNGI